MLSVALRRFGSRIHRSFTTTMYTPSHEWIRFENPGKAVIGITHHAQKELGDVAFVDLPEIGATLGKGDDVVAIESTKAVGDIQMPVDGEIEEVNTSLVDNPDLINQDPEGKGWIFSFKYDDHKALTENKMDRENYDKFLENIKGE